LHVISVEHKGRLLKQLLHFAG